MSLFQRLQRNIAFARHIPPHRILRRVALDVKRRWLQTPGGAPLPDAGSWQNTLVPPRPIFLARTGKLAATPTGYAFTFLGRTQTLGRPVIWRAFTGTRADQLWSMNLHYMEYLEAADDATFETLVTDWLAAALPYGPGYWRDVWNSYAVSLRVVVWMQQLAIRPALPTALRNTMNASLAGQIEFLARNLETDLGGNHLIKNIKALIWASAYFTGAAAARWRRLGLHHLQLALNEQILPDGMHFERSPSYHAQVFADLLECKVALANDSAVLDEALHRMAQVAIDLAHPDGRPALFNDAGLTMCYAPDTCLAAYETIFGRRLAPRAVFALPDAGFFGCRNSGDVFIADCGPIGADCLPAHAHADILSFEWSVAGHRVIVDQGVYEYVAGPKRTASRAAASHNTLTIDGYDQADFFGDFRVGRRPAVRARMWEPRSDGFSLDGTHDGFTHAPGAPRHVRRFDVSPDRVAIRDTIEGENQVGASAGMLLHPDVTIANEGSNPGTELTLIVGGTHIALTATERVRIEPAVWWPDMGVEKPTQRLVIRFPRRSQQVEWAFSVLR